MAEKKTGEGTVRADDTEFESDTTGNDPIEGTRHVGGGVIDQDKNLKEALANDGRSPQAELGATEQKNAGSSPENKAISARSTKRK